MEFLYRSTDDAAGDALHTVELEHEGEHFVAAVGGVRYRVTVRREQSGELRLRIASPAGDERRVRAFVGGAGAGESGARTVWIDGQSWSLERTSRRRRRGAASAAASGGLIASMPGQVRAVHVAAGDSVARGDALVVLEAMKMETTISAPADGRVARVLCEPGQTVERGALLIELENV